MGDESFNCKDVVAEFIKSFGDDTDACVAECMKREQELIDQFQEYAKCIGYLMSDKRYIPIIAIKIWVLYVALVFIRNTNGDSRKRRRR